MNVNELVPCSAKFWDAIRGAVGDEGHRVALLSERKLAEFDGMVRTDVATYPFKAAA